jgi:hypothetical protein
LVLGTRHRKGREGIKQAYNRAPAAPPLAQPQPPARLLRLVRPLRPPLRAEDRFNVTIDNPPIMCGDTATSWSFSPVPAGEGGRSDEDDDAGKEYSTRQQGQWL